MMKEYSKFHLETIYNVNLTWLSQAFWLVMITAAAIFMIIYLCIEVYFGIEVIKRKVKYYVRQRESIIVIVYPSDQFCPEYSQGRDLL